MKRIVIDKILINIGSRLARALWIETIEKYWHNANNTVEARESLVD